MELKIKHIKSRISSMPDTTSKIALRCKGYSSGMQGRLIRKEQIMQRRIELERIKENNKYKNNPDKKDKTLGKVLVSLNEDIKKDKINLKSWLYNNSF